MRFVVAFTLVYLGGCASQPFECAGISDEWTKVDRALVDLNVVLDKTIEEYRVRLFELTSAQWYRRSDESLLACMPGWDKGGCGQETYLIEKKHNIWRGAIMDGIICTG